MPLHLHLKYRFRALHAKENYYLSSYDGKAVQSSFQQQGQEWILRPSQDGHGFFVVLAEGNQKKCLSGTQKNKQLLLEDIQEADNCKWQYFEITHGNSLAVCLMLNLIVSNKIMCADIKGRSQQEGAPAILYPVRWTDKSRNNQLWVPTIVTPA